MACPQRAHPIERHRTDRRPHDPLVVAGGPCAFNPEPLAPFLDAVVLGDGEDAVGDLVEKGQTIAQMGSSGRSTGTHVHFEVLRDGKPVNPMRYVRAGR